MTVAVFEQIKKHREPAGSIFRDYCRRVGFLILNIQSVVDVSTYAIGGGISSQQLLIETINQEYDRILTELPLVKETLVNPEIKQAKFKSDANLYGALYSLLQTIDRTV
ncbi:ROK family protein [Liquorilactobacillus uvarum]|uniref:ROK family protein n=1 Tax=Liquorilactobacillus uvarum TaxID=303240 RepID=UPI00288BF6A0|nr:ROK family protein [Liquorilactobacillus uvarum]